MRPFFQATVARARASAPRHLRQGIRGSRRLLHGENTLNLSLIENKLTVTLSENDSL